MNLFNLFISRRCLNRRWKNEIYWASSWTSNWCNHSELWFAKNPKSLKLVLFDGKYLIFLILLYPERFDIQPLKTRLGRVIRCHGAFQSLHNCKVPFYNCRLFENISRSTWEDQHRKEEFEDDVRDHFGLGYELLTCKTTGNSQSTWSLRLMSLLFFVIATPQAI